jgi:hypothetical protein
MKGIKERMKEGEEWRYKINYSPLNFNGTFQKHEVFMVKFLLLEG